MGKLFVVGTPIGNLEDLTVRAARVLGQVGLVAAEDTRVTRRLLSHLGVRVPLISYHAHNQRSRLPKLLEALEAGDVALVSDAGMPAVSDPGSDLVCGAAAAGFIVEVIPGVSAVTSALALSGLSADAFFFLGFLPRRRKERRERLGRAASLLETLVIFEAPHRLRATLLDMLAELGDRPMAVCRELTKLHEEVFRGSISTAVEHFQAPLGEIVLVVQGAPEEAPPGSLSADELLSVRHHLAQLREGGSSAKDAVAQVAGAFDLPKNAVYRLWLEFPRTPSE